MRFILGVTLLQAVTALIVYVALQGDWRTTWPLFALLALGIGLMTALWFGTLASAQRRVGEARLGEKHAKEREALQVKAERLRAKEREEAARRIMKAQRPRILVPGLMAGGAAGLGLALVLTQFVTLGLLAFAFAGGGAAGYLVRMRQERRRLDLAPPTTIEIGDSGGAPPRRLLRPRAPA